MKNSKWVIFGLLLTFSPLSGLAEWYTAYDYYNGGIAYAHEGDYDRAITSYNKAISLEPALSAKVTPNLAF